MSKAIDRPEALTGEPCSYHDDRVAPSPSSSRAPTQATAGCGRLVLRRARAKTVLAVAFATSPLRLLTPKNHGDAAWIFLATLGGGLVDGDRIDIALDAEAETSALLGTQASTKVYRSPRGCSQRVDVRIGRNAAVAVVPDPVVCFAGARYAQEVHASLAPEASLVVFDAYTSGRAARGERWQFDEFSSRTVIERAGRQELVDATVLDRTQGPLDDRMGRFQAVATLMAIGPRFAPVRDAMLRSEDALPNVLRSPSAIGTDAAVLRVAAERFESASAALRSSFEALANIMGDNPFARKW